MMVDADDIMSLCDEVREIAYAIHLYHGNGYLEKVYENALAHRLRKAGHRVEQQKPITIRDEDGTVIGEYYADIIIDGCLLVELKACRALGAEHKAQLLHYLWSTCMEHGLLVNFGSFKFQIQKLIKSRTNPSQT
jgi:GxxExxY protein